MTPRPGSSASGQEPVAGAPRAPASASGTPSASRSPSASATATGSRSASPEPSRAGNRAGEGRQRPGRQELREPEEERAGPDAGHRHREGGDGGVPVAPEASRGPGEAGLVPSPPGARPDPQAVSGAQDTTEPWPRILPLGSGLVLIGLGLALAFVGLRLRRS
ncbi:hypothetical protein ACLGIH_16400 [Streptomyces sp. HMX87]|uniref:hypothetical protein n=1 Tax=Streptomyces sp. HMX87 TaxID=3390849 RepID=UPI003A8404E2